MSENIDFNGTDDVDEGLRDDELDIQENNEDTSDNESGLSDVDDAQFRDFDPSNIAIEEPPALIVDETNVHLLDVPKNRKSKIRSARLVTSEDDASSCEEGDSRHARKRSATTTTPSSQRRDTARKRSTSPTQQHDQTRSNKSRRKRSNRLHEERIKARRQRKYGLTDVNEVAATNGTGLPLGDSQSSSRVRGVRKHRLRGDIDSDDDTLSVAERRRRELDRKMDLALRGNRVKIRKDDIEISAEREVRDMRNRMIEATQADAEARAAGQPAAQKLRLLPEVIGVLSRNSLAHHLVDPDLNFLEAVRFFLEPLANSSLPAYNIQYQIFTALTHLPMGKDALIASGIGKVTLFYTRTKRAPPVIQRMAQGLLEDWSRLVLGRTDDFRKRVVKTVLYDPEQNSAQKQQIHRKVALEQQRVLDREAALALPNYLNRARVEGGVASYTIAPRVNLTRLGEAASGADEFSASGGNSGSPPTSQTRTNRSSRNGASSLGGNTSSIRRMLARGVMPPVSGSRSRHR